jgi:hypothetical protein
MSEYYSSLHLLSLTRLRASRTAHPHCFTDETHRAAVGRQLIPSAGCCQTTAFSLLRVSSIAHLFFSPRSGFQTKTSLIKTRPLIDKSAGVLSCD